MENLPKQRADKPDDLDSEDEKTQEQQSMTEEQLWEWVSQNFGHSPAVLLKAKGIR